MIPLLMKTWPVMLATVLYACQTSILLWTRDWAGAITFTGYALANIGLIWSLS